MLLTPARPARTIRGLALVLIALVLPMSAATSASASGESLLQDCLNGQLHPPYAVQDYRDALTDVPTDLAEYSDCVAQITAARDKQLSAPARSASRTAPYAAGTKPAGSAVAGIAGATASGTGELTASGSVDARKGAARTTPDATTPQAAPSVESASGDDEFLALPIAGSGDGGGATADDGAGSGIPLVPVIIALSVIALTIARAMVAWSRRPETLPQVDPA